MLLYRKLFKWLGHARWFAFLGRHVFARIDRVMFRLLISSEDFGNERRRSAWPLNLDAKPEARVQVGSERFVCRARRLDEEEVARYWPRLIAVWPAHDTYLERSGRRHVFLLEPKRGTAEGVTVNGDGAPRDSGAGALQALRRRR